MQYFFFIAEAPPSYRDIFGSKEKTESDSGPKRWRRTQRPHTISRRQRGNQQTSCARVMHFPNVTPKLLVIIIALVLLTLPVSMLLIGSLNINVCSRRDIPLYLIIAGCCLMVEILIHAFTFITSLSTDNETTNRSLRLCDCFTFFILIWILIGSNWIFKVSVNSKSCSEVDYEEISDLGNSNNTFPADTTSNPCQDCSNTVYQFTIGVIIIQYIAVFSVFVFCCCVAIKKGSN